MKSCSAAKLGSNIQILNSTQGIDTKIFELTKRHVDSEIFFDNLLSFNHLYGSENSLGCELSLLGNRREVLQML